MWWSLLFWIFIAIDKDLIRNHFQSNESHRHQLPAVPEAACTSEKDGGQLIMTPGIPGDRGRTGPSRAERLSSELLPRCDHLSATAPSSCKGGRQRAGAILRTHIKNTGVSLAAMLLLCYCYSLAAQHEKPTTISRCYCNISDK